MDTVTAGFVDGMGAAAATSGVLSQLQGRIFALLYITPGQLSLDEIADELQTSKSNISTNIRGLVEWHLVRRTSVEHSRKDHYEAATDFWVVMREIMERRFRWNLRQVLASVSETSRALETAGRPAPAPRRKNGPSSLDAWRECARSLRLSIRTSVLLRVANPSRPWRCRKSFIS